MTTQRDLELTLHALELLPEEQRRLLETELRDSPEARAELRAVQEALTALGAAAAVEPPTHLRERVLRATSSETRFEGHVERLARLFDLDEATVRGHLARIDAAPGPDWEAPGVPGLLLYHLEGGPRVADADCGLVIQAPGSDFPRHRHTGDEWSYVLSGAARFDDGRLAAPGDLLRAAPGSRHAYAVEGEEPLIYATVLEGPLEFGSE